MEINKNDFLKKSSETLGTIFDNLLKLPVLKFDDLDPTKTRHIPVDMINAFIREGILQSPRVAAIIPAVADIMTECKKRGIKQAAFADTHTDESPEYEAYGRHGIEGTSECEIVDELKAVGGYTLIPKNSTNGFLEAAFQRWLMENIGTDTFIVTGDCTDICVMQFAVTLKNYFNSHNKKIRVIVPINAVATYDYGLHDGDLLNVVALQMMANAGIELVAKIV